jgi:hypothetical protein
MLSLDILAVVIFLGSFFLIFCVIGCSRNLVTSNRAKDPRRILEAPLPTPSDENGESYSEKVTAEEHPQDTGSSSMSRGVQPSHHAAFSSPRLFSMSKAGLPASAIGGRINIPAATRHEISVAKMRFLIASHRVSGRGLQGADRAIHRQTGIALGRR